MRARSGSQLRFPLFLDRSGETSPSICASRQAEAWPARLADGEPQVGRLAADLFFDCIECPDPCQSFRRCRRGMDGMDFVELASCVRPTRNFIDVAITVQMMESGMKRLPEGRPEVLQMLPWMLSLAIFRVRKPDRLERHLPPQACRRAHTYVQSRAVLGLLYRYQEKAPGSGYRRHEACRLRARASVLHPPAERATHLLHRPNPPALNARSPLPGGHRSPTGEWRGRWSPNFETSTCASSPGPARDRVRSDAMARALPPRGRSRCRRTWGAHGE